MSRWNTTFSSETLSLVLLSFDLGLHMFILENRFTVELWFCLFIWLHCLWYWAVVNTMISKLCSVSVWISIPCTTRCLSSLLSLQTAVCENDVELSAEFGFMCLAFRIRRNMTPPLSSWRPQWWGGITVLTDRYKWQKDCAWESFGIFGQFLVVWNLTIGFWWTYLEVSNTLWLNTMYTVCVVWDLWKRSVIVCIWSCCVWKWIWCCEFITDVMLYLVFLNFRVSWISQFLFIIIFYIIGLVRVWCA